MSISGTPGPLVVFGQNPAQASTNYQPDYNGDLAPSAFVQGTMLLDPRYGFRGPLQAGTLSAYGYCQGGPILVIDEAPATLANAAIAAAAAVTISVPMTLVTSSAAGVVISSTTNVSNTLNGTSTVNTSGVVTYPVSGTVMPVGTLFLNTTPSFIYFGQNGSVAVMDPRNSLGRAVSITANAGAASVVFTVRGWDVHGYAISETITAAASSTVNGKRGFKAIRSVTPGATDAGHTFSVGTADIFEFPLMATTFSQTQIWWNNTVITATTGFVAGVATTMTATNGTARGTYAVQTAADGTKVLQVYLNPAAYNVGQVNGVNSLFGQVQFSN